MTMIYYLYVFIYHISTCILHSFSRILILSFKRMQTDVEYLNARLDAAFFLSILFSHYFFQRTFARKGVFLYVVCGNICCMSQCPLSTPIAHK